MVLLVSLLIALPQFLLLVEARQGTILPDPLLGLLPTLDLTWAVFSVLYAALIGTIAYLALHPNLLLTAVNSYSLMILFRMGAMFLTALEPPPGMIELKDPFVEFFGTGKVLTKDLFFSGHTATMAVLFLNVRQPVLKYLLLAGAVVVGFSVLLQHVHYSIDVFAAPFFAWCAYGIARKADTHRTDGTRDDRG